ncbi:MAG: tetratricopeptide repeat protein [Bacteroidaceae bacterium]|nr:tetratricopeptide repeat protein [Bacteroidaceae bacterium]
MRTARAIILFCLLLPCAANAQLNTEQVMIIGRNALYFEDYVLSIQYFNRVITARPYLHEPYFFRGLAKYNLEDYSGAEEDLTLSIERNPYVARYYQLRGLCRAGLEDYSGAESDFRMALRYDPQNVNIWQNLAITEIRREEWGAAASVIDTMLIFSPRDVDTYLLRSQVASKMEDSLVAHKMVDEALRYDKYSPDAYTARAALYADEKLYSNAEEDMDRAIGLLPGRSASYLSRALIRYYRENLRGAMDDFDTALYIDPKNFYGYYNRGLLRMQVGDDNRAIEDFNKVLEIDPDNTLARFNRGLLRNNTGDVQGAIDDFTRVLEDYPNFDEGYRYRSAARRRIGDIKGAEADELWLLRFYNSDHNKAVKSDTASVAGDKVRKRSDRNVRNYNKLVVADEEPRQQYETAYRGKVQDKYVDVQVQPIYTLTYYRQERDISTSVGYCKPIEDVNSARLFSRNVLLTNDERALSEDEVGRHFKGVDDNSKCIADFPDALSYRVCRAMDYYLVQNFDAAIADLEIAFTLEGEMWPVYFMRAMVRYKMLESYAASHDRNDAQQVAGALPNMEYRLVKNDLDAVIEQLPDFAQAYYNRANVYLKLSDFKSAVVDYTKAIELDGNMAAAYFNRGLARIYLGDRNDGIADLSKAGELGVYAAYNVIKRFSDKQ